MDDECSVLSSCYWDATSITSDGTIPTEFYHTPTGSIIDIPLSTHTSDTSKDSRSVTPAFYNMNEQTFINEELEIVKDEPETSQSIEIAPMVSEIVLRPPLNKQQKTQIEENVENKNEDLSRKRSWKHDIAKRFSSTKSRLIKSFSISKNKDETKKEESSRNIFQSMRHSIRKFKSFDKKSNRNKNTVKVPSKSASAVIGSDCDYFNFAKDTEDSELTKKSEEFSIDLENEVGTPLKPRRQFTQEKYLTGSRDILKKAFNSLKRKSHMQDDKSLFDICSTVSYLFSNELDEMLLSKTEEKLFQKFMNSCVNSFLDVHKIQIEKSLEMVNRNIGEHLDLNSPDLDVINKSKKYQVTEIFGLKGICIITNTGNKKKFIALKQGSKNWVLFTSFLQHIEPDSTMRIHQEWICFPAQSITNLYIEKNFFNPLHIECKLLLDSLIQLVVILYCQTIHNIHIKLNPSNILIVSSNLSIIFVFIDSDAGCASTDESQWLNLHDYSDKEMRLAYQQSIMKLNNYVERFLSLPENASHLITASYPLDYLFYIFLKLNKDICILLNSL